MLEITKEQLLKIDHSKRMTILKLIALGMIKYVE